MRLPCVNVIWELPGMTAMVVRSSVASLSATETATPPTLPTLVTGLATLMSLASTVRLAAVISL